MVAFGEDPSLQGDCTFPGWQVTGETFPLIGVNSGIPMSLILLKCLISAQLHLYAVCFMDSPVCYSSESKGPFENRRTVD